MHSFKFFMFFLFVYLLSTLNCLISAADPTYLYHYCINTTSLTTNSTYQSNVKLFLSNANRNVFLTSLLSYVKHNSFYNATAGDDPNKVYGLFLCRGDVNSSSCQDCVNFATSDVTKRCPVQKETVIWYDECLLRYSNKSFFSTMDPNPSIIMYNTNNVSESSRFTEVVMSVMNEAATQAAHSPKRFMTKEGNFTPFQTLYSLVQCTQDLSSGDCNRCLQESFANLRTAQVGARVLFPSCYSRFELYPFYNEELTVAPAPEPDFPPPLVSMTRPKGRSQISPSIIGAITAPIAVAALLLIVGSCLLRRRARKKSDVILEDTIAGNDITTAESLQFGLHTIEIATNKFSTDNKLGEGGFGQVFKGIFPNGRAIAVKRLSRRSVQGAEEFKNEIVLLAKLQHRNLVRLLGFCLEGEEKILVYEFVPNKSLHYFLYELVKQRQLDWSIRYKIIGGIIRGMLYLHEDSRLKIIHRDLKASNILLDEDMNPKISDFGLARMVAVDESQVNTNKIVGTYGYISPEYAVHGQFSVKSDVYSFGVLVLEIITGKKNSHFYQTEGAENLMSYAWKHWRDGTPLQLLDSTLRNSYSRNEVIRCIHMGLLCVQEDPAERPTMATIDLMLNSYSVTLPSPKKPAFFLGGDGIREVSMPTKEFDSDPSTNKPVPWSVNEASISEVYPR